MKRTAGNVIVRVGLAPVLALMVLSAAGCSVSACAGSGCDSGKIFFGTNFKQDSNHSSISVVGKRDTFTMGQNVAMVANLSENAGTKTLTLEVSHNGAKHSVPYHIDSASSNELANLFNKADLTSLGVTAPGSYTFHVLHGSKELAKGSMTEK